MSGKTDYRNDLRNDGFVEFSVSVNPEECRILIDEFVAFVEEVGGYCKDFGLVNNEEKKYHIGYYEELREDEYQGNKQIFHYNKTLSRYEEKFPNRHRKEYLKLKESADVVFSKVAKDVERFIKDLDSSWPGLASKFFDDSYNLDLAENLTLRAVRYTGTQRDNYLIEPHFDRGTCTFLIGENASGLRLYTDRSDLSIKKLYEPKPLSALFIPGINFKIATGGDVFPLWHDVVDMKSSNDTPRVSILMFLDVLDVQMFSYKERYDKSLWHN